MVSLPAILLATVLSGSGETELLEFTADWCGHCRTMEPTIRRLQNEGYPVRKINVDQQPDVAQRFGVGPIPCSVFVSDGREVDRIEGAVSHDRLVELFKRAGYRPRTDRMATVNAAAGVRAQLPDGQASNAPSAQNIVPLSAGAGLIARGAAPNPAGSAVVAREVASPKLTPEQLALQATVRIKVVDDRGNSYATGTIIDTHAGEALVLTCGHVFRESKGRGKIVVDLFMPGATGPVQGELLSYEAERRDIGLISIRPGLTVQSVRVASVSHHPRPGDAIFSVGCDHGGQPSVRPSTISSVDRYTGPPNLEIKGHPVDGRSGGGLFTADGRLIGVCNSADLQEDRGIYAALRTVHLKLKQIGLEHIYLDESAPGPMQMASAGQSVLPGPVLPGPVLPGPGSERTIPPVTAAPTTQRFVDDDTEVICIVRSRSQPQGQSRVLVLDRPSPDFLQHLTRESERSLGTPGRIASLPGNRLEPLPNLAAPPNRGPILRGQNQR